MAMFGGLARKKAPFDFSPEVYQTPGIGDGLAGAIPMGEPGLGAAPVAPEKKGVDWARVMGIVSDGLAGAIGQPGQYAAGLRRDKEIQRQDSLYQRHRADQMADWKAKQEWERANPGKPQPTEFERILDAGNFSPEDRLRLIRQRATNTADPLQAITTYGPDGSQGLQFVRPSQMGGGGGPDLGGAGGGPTPAPSSGGFMTLDQFKAMRTVPTFKSGHPAWQTPVRVTTQAEYGELPSGKTYIAPDGSVRTKK